MQRVVAQVAVDLALHLAHGGPEQQLALGRQAALHIRLDAAQQEGAQQAMQLAHHLGAAHSLGFYTAVCPSEGAMLQSFS